MNRITVALLLAVVIMSACNSNPPKMNTTQPQIAKDTVEKDWHTLSNADSVTMKHLDLDIKVDMEHHNISGAASWAIENKDKVNTLKLDTYDLTIDSVLVDGNKVQHTLDSPIQFLGSRLNIPINNDSRTVTIYYKTGKNATALQWLSPQQTHDKTHPFLYTQSESIFARTWVPCPDGPGIRFTYTARVTVPKGLMALMSAENTQQVSDSGIYHFTMDNPIPAYLMALAVGDIAFRSIDNRTGVYAEPGMVDKARWEFEDVGKMVNAAEKLYGPYRWGRYDVLVLPPGFPIGGMENPRLTFATPTVIAGDRSLVSLVAHELAHSWSGNLVTNATWDDFWLNEGFTDYFERRIMQALKGKDYSDMLWDIGYQDLVDQVNELGKDSRDTWLKADLKGRSTEDGFTDIPYEKGSHFLKLIENTVGREKWDAFLIKYFNEHAFKSINTEQFLIYLRANLIKGDSSIENKININAWVYGPGIPANCPRVIPERFKVVDTVREQFLSGTPAGQLNTTGWTTFEWLHFLRNLPAPLPMDKMVQLDNAFHFTTSGNSEIADLWYLMSIKTDYKKAYPAMENFLSTVGREKFLQPLYGEMMKTGKQEMAKSLYAKYRVNYHPLAQASIDKIVK
ncbi:MAG TPA: M1 family metallopeptidase [Flavipsychrobacter sp.]|nr:M1 family metallopeptidase [Flavipsychrobacter sp.]